MSAGDVDGPPDRPDGQPGGAAAPSLHRGALAAMLAGTVLIGLSAFVFLAAIGHGRVDPAAAAALSAVYLLAVILGPGVYVAVEQETSRVISAALGRGTNPARRRLLVVNAILTAGTLLVLLAAGPALLSLVLDGQVDLLLALALSVVGSAAVYAVRGLAGGHQRFGRYAATTLIDGGARIVGTVGLVLAGSTAPGAYALALCAGPGVAWLCTARGSATTDADQTASATTAPPPYGELGRDIGRLLIASWLSLALANLAPVIVTGMLTGDPTAAAGFAAAVVFTRAPLLLMAPIQAMLLPRLTTTAVRGDLLGLRRTVGVGLAAVAGFALLSTLAVAVAGHWAVATLLGSERDTVSTPVLVLLTASGSLFLVTQLLQPALVALRRHRALMVAWLVGGGAFGLCFLLPLTPVDRGLAAQLVGPAATALVQLLVLARAVVPAGAATGPGSASGVDSGAR